MPEIHARLGASSAHRWMNCPRSVKLEEQFPEETSEFAEEGTKAHALAERILNIFIKEGRRPEELTDLELDVLDDGSPTPMDMKDAVLKYVHWIIRDYDELSLNHKDVILLAEVMVDLSDYIPEGFGTNDCCLIAGDELRIYDYKHGKGVAVECVNNPQTRLYALGAIKEFDWEYDLKTVKTHIIQPRIGNYGHEELSVDQLKEWGDQVIKPAAQRAWNDEGEYKAGEWCQFCKARGQCRARALQALNSYIKWRDKANERK